MLPCRTSQDLEQARYQHGSRGTRLMFAKLAKHLISYYEIHLGRIIYIPAIVQSMYKKGSHLCACTTPYSLATYTRSLVSQSM